LRRSGDLLDIELLDREVQLLAIEIPDWDVRTRWDRIRSHRTS
jgi:hypothetical protein